MSDAVGVVLLILVGIVWLVVKANTRPEVVTRRRHDKYAAKFQAAQTPSDQVRYALDYLGDVCRSIDSEHVLSKVAAEVYALAAKRNGTPTTSHNAREH